MLFDILKQLKIAAILLLLLTIITGVIYPISVTLIAQLFFPRQANGSLITFQGKLIGSELIGQSFTDPSYFWGRPSATSPFPNNAENSSGSNLGPTNVDLINMVEARIKKLQPMSGAQKIPVDLVTASASGLDPDISPYAAYYQIPRIAKIRNIQEQQLRALVDKLIIKRTFGILGEPRVNVLELNLALNELQSKS